MILVIVLNAVFSALVLSGIVALHLQAIAKSHHEQVTSERLRLAPSPAAAAPVRQAGWTRRSLVRSMFSTARGGVASSQAFS